MSLLKKIFGSKGDISSSQTEAEGVLGVVSKLFDKNEKEVAKLRPIVEQIGKIGEELRNLSDDELKARSAALRQRFRDEVTSRLAQVKNPADGKPYEWQELDTQLSWSDDYAKTRLAFEKEVLELLLPEAFALCREAGDRTIGLRHFDVQLIGGMGLHHGKIAEMRTGEGKTLVATLPAYLNALSGRGVHVVTVNDYLAERDANWMRPIYEFLGLTVAFLQNDMESEQRQVAYACDILYGTNSEFGFDYLRDNMARTPQDMVQRPLNYALIDEVDNILIDEARTPLIISAQVAKTDRALRRQQMAQTCDGVARKLMPGVTDREVEAFIDEFSSKKSVDIGALANGIFARGAFKEATDYLIDAYLLSEKSARTDSAARLLDVAGELADARLIDSAGREILEKQAIAATRPQALREAWRAEIQHLLTPFNEAYVNAGAADYDINSLAHDLAFSEEAALELEPQIAEAEDKAAFTALIIADEMARRGLIMPEATDETAAALQSGPDALTLTVLERAGALSEADALLKDNVPDAATVDSPGAVRQVVGALEEIAARGLLPFETQEHLWATVQLPQGRDGLRKELAKVIASNPGAAAAKITTLTQDYEKDRTKFLEEQAAKLRDQISAHLAVSQRAGQGAGADELRELLQKELAKSGPFAQATKLAAQFVKDRNAAYGQVADHLLEEMSQWVEVPRDAKRVIIDLLAEGGRQPEVAERLMMAVRDLPGDATELAAITNDAAHQLQSWRDEQSLAFVDKVNALIPIGEEEQSAIRRAIEDGDYTAGFEAFVGQQLLASPEIAPLSSAIDSYGDRWDQFKTEQNQKLIDGIASEIKLSADARDDLAELLGKPLSGKLDAAIYSELAADSVARHLEPLLADENAPAFTDEVKRRIPLSKDVSGKLKSSEFAGRSAGQLSRALQRLAVRSLEGTAYEDYKRVVKNLGWYVEKDEKRRTAALTDMGTLVAEREAGEPVFTDPENFLETLLQGEILTEEEAVLVERAQAESPDQTITEIIDRMLRLPAERRRRLAESKLQEVQPILDQGIKAHALFQYNVNYVIGGGKEIVIVDEFTGRTMPGRRFSEGLHEALEAKHGLEVQIESQTVATITIQNYFRLYNKIAGLTGTAKTEETEFGKTYGIEVMTVPTNRPVRRKDEPDVVYKTAEAKFRALTFDLLEHHCAGQPVLVGTRSVEMSERMGQRLSATALQTLVLTHLIKDKIMPEKMSQEEKTQLLAFVRQPLPQLNPMQIKALAKQVGLAPEATADENVDKLLSLFTIPNVDRNRLVTALKQGLPHNVLNAKNHRNEARIIAEAARPGAVTIATNMAGRGVDIILGGSLDGESRWRVITEQLLARAVEGKSVHVRSRNAESTQKLNERLFPQNLQTLAWAVAVGRAVDELERTKALEGQASKDMKDALGSDLTSADFANRVRARARRYNLLEKLPVDLQPLDGAIVREFAAHLEKLMGRAYDVESVAAFLEGGVPAQETASHDLGLDPGELAVLYTLARPLAFSQDASESLLEVLNEVPNLDEKLLELVAAGGNLHPEALAANLEVVTPEWVAARLQELNVPNSMAAEDRLGDLPKDVIEVSELQIAQMMGEQFMGIPWLRQRLSEWQVVTEARGFEATPEQQQMLQDQALVFIRLDKKALAKARAAWSLPHRRRDMVGMEVPNLVLLQELSQVVGPDAPILDPEWLHNCLNGIRILQSDEDVFQAQMMAQVQDEEGNESVQPIDVLVYKLRLTRALEAVAPVVREAAKQVGESPDAIFNALQNVAPWLPHFVDADWVKKILAETPAAADETPRAVAVGAPVQIETGVAGQSADIVLESEARPEDIAHTSEQELVKELGGLHIIATERHESRRIDNQLRGRAGRQGDPGSSRFYISLEDELWRLFGTRGQFLLGGWDEDEPVEAKIITKSIERAQKKVELNHFESRKHVLQYDDVMNVQREVIYRERRRALQGDDIRDTVVDMAQKAALAEAEKHCPRDVRPEEWDARKLYLGLGRLFGLANLQKHVKEEDLHDIRWHERSGSIANADWDVTMHNGVSFRELVETLYEDHENQLGTDTVRSLERWQVMRSIDEHWMEHLAEMDYLRDAIWQQGYAQKEPIGVYRQEGFALFQKMLGEIRREVTEAIFGYQSSSFDEVPEGIDFGDLTEARLLDVLPMDDGLDDGVMLDKDDEGEDDTIVLAHQSASAPRNAGTTAAPAAEPSNRAERRANKKRR